MSAERTQKEFFSSLKFDFNLDLKLWLPLTARRNTDAELEETRA